jgi:hypothetical protein
MRRPIERKSAEAVLVHLQNTLQPVHLGIAGVTVHSEAVVRIALATNFRAKTIYLSASIVSHAGQQEQKQELSTEMKESQHINRRI